MQVSREIFSADKRNELIRLAVNSEGRGHFSNYYYNVYPKKHIHNIDENDKKKQEVHLSELLADVIYKKDFPYRKLSLGFYELLHNKLYDHDFLSHYRNDIVMVIKGSNAYAILLDEKNEDFSFSDLDVMIFINPTLNEQIFQSIKNIIITIVLQVISQYKRSLDHLLFLDRDFGEPFIDKHAIENFKKDFVDVLKIKGNDEYIAPFLNQEVRNECSRNSIMICPSNIPDKIVKIEIPHFPNCERIPLRKTPLFASYNSTISFNRSNDQNLDQIDGEFDLVRLRLNCLHKETKDRFGIDFIDVSIPSNRDRELLSFWAGERRKYIVKKDSYTDIWLNIVDIHSAILDLENMLTIYQCPEWKREKRKEKLEKLKMIHNSNQV